MGTNTAPTLASAAITPTDNRNDFSSPLPGTDTDSFRSSVRAAQSSNLGSSVQGAGVLHDLQERQLTLTRELARRNAQEVEQKITAEREAAKSAEIQKQADLYSAVRARARQSANATFDRDPGSHLDAAELQTILHEIIKDKKVRLTEEEAKALVQEFQKSYDETFNTKFSGMSWVSQKYYSAKQFVSSSLDASSRLVSGLVAAGGALLDMAGSVVTGAGNVISSVYTYATSASTWDSVKAKSSAAWDFVSSRENWHSLGSAIYRGSGAVKDFLTDPETYNSIGRGLSRAVAIIRDPQTWKTIGNGILSARESLIDFTAACINDPSKAWGIAVGVGKAALRFGKELCDSTGVSDLVSGLYNLATLPLTIISAGYTAVVGNIKGLYQLAKGDITVDQFKEIFKNNVLNAGLEIGGKAYGALSSLKGAALIIGELTGVTDLVLAGYYASKGDWAQAGLHGAFALAQIGSIAATFLTAGAAVGAVAGVMMLRTTIKNAMKKVLKTAVKEFFEVGARQIGKAVSENLVEKVGKQGFDRFATKIVDEGVKSLSKQVSKHGEQILTGELITETFESVANKATQRLLRKHNVDKMVKDMTLELLESSRDLSTRKLAKNLEKLGLSNPKSVAKQVQKCLKSTRSDSEILDVLSGEISKPIYEAIQVQTEKSFKNRFKAALSGELEDKYSKQLAEAVEAQAARRGIPKKELVEEYVEAGWKGCKKGIKEGAEKIVREAVEKALKEFRNGHTRVPHITLKKVHKENVKRQSKLSSVMHADEAAPEAVEAKVAAEVPVTRSIEHKSEMRSAGGKRYQVALSRSHGELNWKTDAEFEVADVVDRSSVQRELAKKTG